MNTRSEQVDVAASARWQLQLAWWFLLGFLSLGILLEALHGLKVGWYVDVSNATRRHMWTLAHAHGTLLALIQMAFALSLRRLPDPGAVRIGFASRCLVGATILLPGGFLLGGLFIYAGDPGLGILLVPLGAALLFASVFLMARGLAADPRAASGDAQTSAAGSSSQP